MGRLVGVTNKLTTWVKDKLQTVMDDVVSKLDITKMTTDQEIRMLHLISQQHFQKMDGLH